MMGINFAATEWVHALWGVVAFVALLVWFERGRGGALREFVSSVMQPRLVLRASTRRRYLRIACLGLSALTMVVALMRPQWGLTFVATPRVGSEIMVCLDVSKSMLAEDVAPSRLERAKAELQDLLPYLSGDHVGLIVFAGKASVACPLTPDFGFFRLVLDGVGVHSVARGGTQLSEPIRKAVAGFGEATDISRAILLITDGEDHDSFPTEAAQAAAERGIKIIAIGFGDEVQGSEIRYTDPRTGAVRTIEFDGKPVLSRLDGDTLREIAKLTEGAYVPAGTGVLDLQSIYDRHISPLTRGSLDGSQRAVRQEGFQYAVVVALLLLIAAAALTGGRTVAPSAAGTVSPKAGRRAAALLLAGALLGAALPSDQASAQSASSPTASGAPSQGATPNGAEPAAGSEGAPDATDAAEASTVPELEIPEDPREAYNAGLERMNADDFEAAEKLLLAARDESGADGELRFRVTYNLGYLEAKRADRLRESEPEEALKAYQAAADWFRDAIRLRTGADEPRHNLEVVLRQALLLADQLRERDERELTERVDALISEQRALAAEVRTLVEQVAQLDDPNEISGLRQQFRDQARGQRRVNSNTGLVFDDVRAERDTIEGTPEDERTPEQGIRAVQLDNLLHYVRRARERMGQARRQFRQKQAERAYRRASTALTELKRARDQLRNPVEVISAAITDLSEVGRYTVSLAASGQTLGATENPAPAWLTPKYLDDTHGGVTERTTELRMRLEAGLERGAAAANDDPDAAESGDAANEAAEAEKFLAQVEEAMPFVTAGEEALVRGKEHLAESKLEEASAAQLEALRALLEARERFLDLRGLIELLYTDEKKIQQILQARDLPTPEGEVPFDIAEYLPQVIELQGKNVERGLRLGELLAEERAAAGEEPEEDPNNPNPTPTDDPQAQERQRLELAQKYLDSAQVSMTGARDELESASLASPADLATSDELVRRSIDSIESLRRLFFSIVEHLQETARRQMELNDETEEVATLAEPEERPARLGPLGPRQRDLSTISEQIADALARQSQQDFQGAEANPQQAEAMQEQSAKLARAAELVTAARAEMQEAEGGILDATDFDPSTNEPAAPSQDEPDDPLTLARRHQDTALQQLAEALALLQPPQDQEQQQQDQKENEGEQEQEQQQEEEEEESADPAQLLQGVRDREAERRKERERRQSGGYEPVEKDW